MDPSGTSVLKKMQLPSAPVFIATTGLYEVKLQEIHRVLLFFLINFKLNPQLLKVEYRIVVSCRDGNIYSIKKASLKFKEEFYIHATVS